MAVLLLSFLFPSASDTVKDITLNCPTNMLSGNFSLDNPSIPVNLDNGWIVGIELQDYHLLCKCLHENVINEVIMITVLFTMWLFFLLQCGDHYRFDRDGFTESIFIFDMEQQPSDSLCLIGGTYSFKGYSPLVIPPKTCEIFSSSSERAGNLKRHLLMC